MSEKYKAYDTEGIHFVTISVVQWVDVFTRREYCDIICDSLAYCQREKGLQLSAWCLMTNHLHLICSSPTLSNVMRDFKKHTSRLLLEAIKQNPQESRKDWLLWLFRSAGERSAKNEVHKFWQDGFHPKLLYNTFLVEQKLEYLHQNPVKAGFVDTPEHWYYSSARDYAGEKGRLSITLIE